MEKKMFFQVIKLNFKYFILIYKHEAIIESRLFDIMSKALLSAVSERLLFDKSDKNFILVKLFPLTGYCFKD